MLPVENGCGNIWTMPIGPKGEKRLAETRTLAPSNRTLRGNLGQYQPLSISHQGQLPAVTISFNLALGVALGQATNVIQHAQDELQLPATVVPSFLGNAQAFQDSLSTVWILIVGALVVVYLILGILYESYIHPITIISTLPSAGVGALAALMLFHFDFSLIALIGIILLRHREEERHHAGRFRIGGPAGRSPVRARCGAPCGASALPADHDDHNGGNARRSAADARHGGPAQNSGNRSGYAIVGGLLVGQALTLFTTPVIYIYLDQLSDWISNWRTQTSNLEPQPQV
jgi:HAE1 family hydrophobic/amphiphilic exporter-1